MTDDVVNVRDFGAVGDGITDDTTAFNAAIDYAWSLFTALPAANTTAGAIVFIPAGTYYIGTPPLILDGNRDPAVVLRGGVCKFVGAGRDVTIIKGNHYTGEQPESHNNSFLVQWGRYGIKGVNGIYNLTIWNESTGIASGALICGNSGNEVCIDNCRFIGSIGYVHDLQTFGHSITNCVAICTKTITAADAVTPSPLYDANNFLSPVSGLTPPGRFYGTVGFAIGQVYAVNNVATGFDVGFSINALGNTVVGNKAVQCGIGFMGGYTVGTSGQGESGEDGYPSFGAPGCGVQGSLISNRAERCTWGIYGHASVMAGNVIFGDRGPYVGTSGNSREYGINSAGGNSDVILASNVAEAPVSAASFLISNTASERNRVMCMRAPDGWLLTNPASNAAPAWLFDQCDVAPFITYSALTAEWNIYHTGMQPSMEFNISDGSPDGAAFAATISGGGSNHYKVRYDGGAWRRVA